MTEPNAMTTPRKVTLAAAAAALLGALIVALVIWHGGAHAAPASAATPPAATAAASVATPSPAADPYAVYLANNPRPDLVLSREDAQTRALLGCGQTFAPGTIDAVLAAAYRPTGICG